MKILAVETSCDDTGIAILEYSSNSQPKILADLVSSQIKIHAPWGGVVPMLAKREHQNNLVSLLKQALKKANNLSLSRHSDPANAGEESRGLSATATRIRGRSLGLRHRDDETLSSILDREPELLKKLLPFLKKYPKPNIDHIAVTYGPGLEPALWVGVNLARALSYWWDIPIIPINHIEGHLIAAFSSAVATPRQRGKQSRIITAVHGIAASSRNCGTPRNDTFPAIALVVSGGHTQLILVKKIGGYKIIGETRDDAAGEAFDKVAKMLGLGYPGGPVISQLAEKWKSKTKNYKLQTTNFSLPRPMLNSGNLDFSFSGLKTAVLYTLQKMTPLQIKKSTTAIAAEFQQAVIDVLIAKTILAAKKHSAKTIILAGGVAANKALRDNLSGIAERLWLDFLVPPLNLCMDNAAMIALAAYWQLRQKRAKKTAWHTLKALANLRIS